MKLSELDAEALEHAAAKTYEYEWSGAVWANLSETEKRTYRKEVGACIAAYLAYTEKTKGAGVSTDPSSDLATT